MTKQLHKLARELQSRLLAGGGPHRNQMEPVVRDGWASLVRWHESGERLWRIEPDEETPTLADDTVLSTAPTFAAAVCYQGPDRKDWIVVARHGAAEEIRVAEGEAPYGYPEPMITYVTSVDSGIAAGCINLEQQPTWKDVYLPAGKSGERWLNQDDIVVEERRFLRALAHFFRPPAIVV